MPLRVGRAGRTIFDEPAWGDEFKHIGERRYFRPVWQALAVSDLNRYIGRKL